MSRLYVGQRVRIKWSYGWPEIADSEGTIISKSPTAGLSGGSEWVVKVDLWGSHVAPRRSKNGAPYFWPSSDQLEPITDSYDLVTWESMRDLWVPDHMREDA